jgi:hypothetical protein
MNKRQRQKRQSQTRAMVVNALASAAITAIWDEYIDRSIIGTSLFRAFPVVLPAPQMEELFVSEDK